ncbi:MAG TPA: primosomal protein N' [Candidatus Nanopelagicaceae bacterium]|nr:primosomal protein N' [Candidatus Nanopelagicaceae bacterium]
MTKAPPRVARVAPDLPAGPPGQLYDYQLPEHLRESIQLGQRVVVPFGRRHIFAFVVELLEESPVEQLRQVERIRDQDPLLLPHQISLAQWISAYYLSPIPDVIRAMVPPALRTGRPGARATRRRPRTPGEARTAAERDRPPLQLSPDQEGVFEPIRRAVLWSSPEEFLLFGVTGSGKTEIYLAAIRSALDQGRGAIVLIPEISLTPQTVARFSVHFPRRVAVLHSGLTVAERGREWRRVRAGEADVVVGSRSAIFAPMPNLGVVIVDEEDSTSYKQYDRVPRYHAVEVARRLGRILSIPVVLGSATPRLETYHQAKSGAELAMLRLAGRYGGRPLPPVTVVDLREELAWGNRSPFSRRLAAAVTRTLAEGGQSILFLNRRGISSVVLCRGCGEALGCPNCAVSLTLHAIDHLCTCHYCGHQLRLPDLCPSCGGKILRPLGAGTERVEAEARALWPAARILRMDRDTVGHRDAHREIYEAFAERRADVLIGTQMVAKGWDLPGVRLVGIVNADIALNFPDFRASERTFSLLTQVAGRAGRGDEPAEVILQTYSPEHEAVERAVNHDYEGFAEMELEVRRQLRFPPFSKLLVLTRSAAVEDEARADAEREAGRLRTLAAELAIEVLGPAPAFIPKLRTLYRWQVTLRGARLDGLLEQLPSGRGWALDVDPG